MYEINILDELISKERRQELEEELEEVISDYKNNIICRKKFIFIIKKYKFYEYYYLWEKYIGIEDKYVVAFSALSDAMLITESNYDDVSFDKVKNTINYNFNSVRKIRSIESMKTKKNAFDIKKKIRKM